ncbi:MAG: sugar O-acyltransferase, partial [Candidatus Melainabacteria bacterium HGW-Melainabacteria-1]
IGDYFSAGAQLNTGGNCRLGQRVYCGMSVSIRNRVQIADDVTLGMGSVVVGDITRPGLYFGHPARPQPERLAND